MDGTLCENPVTEKGGRCRWHPEGAFDEKKAAFLEAYERLHVIVDAAAEIGVTDVTVFRWRQADPEFAAEVSKLQVDLEDVRYANLEQSMYARAIAGKAAAAEAIFLLVNESRRRGDERFKNTRSVDIQGRIGMYAAIARMPETEVERILALPQKEQEIELARVVDPHGALGLLAVASENGGSEEPEDEG